MKCEINPGNTLETCQSILGINPSHSQIYSWYWHKLSLSVPDLHKNSKKTKHVAILWNKIPSLKLGWEFVLGDFAVCLFPPPKKKKKSPFWAVYKCCLAYSGEYSLTKDLSTVMEHCGKIIFIGHWEAWRKILWEYAHYFNQNLYLFAKQHRKDTYSGLQPWR